MGPLHQEMVSDLHLVGNPAADEDVQANEGPSDIRGPHKFPGSHNRTRGPSNHNRTAPNPGKHNETSSEEFEHHPDSSNRHGPQRISRSNNKRQNSKKSSGADDKGPLKRKPEKFQNELHDRSTEEPDEDDQGNEGPSDIRGPHKFPGSHNRTRGPHKFPGSHNRTASSPGNHNETSSEEFEHHRGSSHHPGAKVKDERGESGPQRISRSINKSQNSKLHDRSTEEPDEDDQANEGPSDIRGPHKFPGSHNRTRGPHKFPGSHNRTASSPGNHNETSSEEFEHHRGSSHHHGPKVKDEWAESGPQRISRSNNKSQNSKKSSGSDDKRPLKRKQEKFQNDLHDRTTEAPDKDDQANEGPSDIRGPHKFPGSHNRTRGPTELPGSPNRTASSSEEFEHHHGPKVKDQWDELGPQRISSSNQKNQIFKKPNGADGKGPLEFLPEKFQNEIREFIPLIWGDNVTVENITRLHLKEGENIFLLPLDAMQPPPPKRGNRAPEEMYWLPNRGAQPYMNLIFNPSATQKISFQYGVAMPLPSFLMADSDESGEQ
ncbi:sarcoplasmic reticulum histidine-rich calcium-binding protein-like isoform X2 [Denticeps clupeoides]|uniref:sarcoplasmic reticulum histidine-rich calcium-binding protein-like isoform X2 n=1 Tax=Denticeps clupeoides TaxID=299321 RepID=UPI0010A3A3DE|nr:sarcoplasmic reticulum histidine-rich calcium-binding protein-like isoform X2 [Denticeps clupeoides]